MYTLHTTAFSVTEILYNPHFGLYGPYIARHCKACVFNAKNCIITEYTKYAYHRLHTRRHSELPITDSAMAEMSRYLELPITDSAMAEMSRYVELPITDSAIAEMSRYVELPMSNSQSLTVPWLRCHAM